MRHWVAGFALLAITLALGGCISANSVADMIVTAPNHGHPQAGKFAKVADAFYTYRLQVSAAPVPATLAVAIIAPRNYGFSASEKWAHDNKTLKLKWEIRNNPTPEQINKPKTMKFPEAMDYFHHMLAQAIPKLPICRPSGTVILLPGWGETKETLLGYALDLANHGYRVVLVDLRGQGESSGHYVTYGLIEHHDVGEVISALYAHHLVAGKLVLIGFSEGASIALDTAARDPRLDAVVAVAPFVNLETAIRGVGNFFMPDLSKMVSDEKLDHALELADKKVNRRLANANPALRVEKIRAPVLYVAGGKDKISPAADVKALAAKTPEAEFHAIPRYPHIALYFGVAKVGPLVLGALSETMGRTLDQACLSKPPPREARYDFRFIFNLKKEE